MTNGSDGLRHLFVALAALVSAISSESTVRYDNYRVYQINPKTAAQLGVVQELDGLRDAYVFLEPVHYVDSNLTILVSPQNRTEFETLMEVNHLHAELLSENAQLDLDSDLEDVADPNLRGKVYNWERYHVLSDTYSWMQSLEEQWPQKVAIFEAGRSYKGRQILGVKISFGSGGGKEGIFLEAGMHAREWISPATATFVAHQLLTSTNGVVRRMAKKYDWYIVPHANPDGYVYTHTADRLWRKTRKPYGGRCFGADPNRNWRIHWNKYGSSQNPCSDTYAGPRAFSEVETRTMAEFLKTLRGQIFLYISIHSYSQLLMYPYGYTSKLPPNNENFKRILNAALRGIRTRYGTRYKGGTLYNTIYPASGSTLDWAYDVLNVEYAFCYELRPQSRVNWSGFRLPASQIIPTAEETFDSIVEMVKEASNIKHL